MTAEATPCKHDERHMSATVRVMSVPPPGYEGLGFVTPDGTWPMHLNHSFDEPGTYEVRSCQVCGEPLWKRKVG